MIPFPTREAYRQAWQAADEADPPVPLNIDIEIASLCNLRCPFCFIPDPNFKAFIAQRGDDGKPLRRIMPTELAMKIIDEAALIGVPALKFNWRGESTIAPNYSEIVRYAASKGKVQLDGAGACYVESPCFLDLLANTNANCPDAAIDGLMACTKVMVSLDSMDPQIYPQMRVGGDLRTAKNTIWNLVRRGHQNVWVRRVLTQLNAKEDFFDAVKNEWGDKVKVSEHFCFDRNAKTTSEIVGCDHDNDMARRYCGYPSQRLIITSAGLAYPCCLDLHETMRVGDINKQSLLDIWHGEPLRDLRHSLRQNRESVMGPTCQNCQSWMAYQAPQREFVQDRENTKIQEATR